MAGMTYENAMTALRAADAAGNAEDARRIAKIAASLKGQSEPAAAQNFPIMSNVNRGIADSVGGLVDLINPFDQPHALNPFSGGTGSARNGLTAGMESIGIEVADGEPQSLPQALARGAGSAAGAMIPAAKAAQGLSGLGGIAGRIAGDAAKGLTSKSGLTVELASGATSEAARDLAADAGAPEWAQQTAAIAGGLTPAAVPLALQASPTRLAVGAVKRNIVPYTEAGGREIARQRMQSLAGGEDRAAELAARIDDQNEFGLTPAQQTQDPNMLGVERLASEQDAALRSRLDDRLQSTQDQGRDAVLDMGGDPVKAREFFSERREAFKAQLQQSAQNAQDAADAQISALGPNRPESENSLIVRQHIDDAYAAAKNIEAELWAAVPRDAAVATSATKRAVQSFQDSLPYAQRDDLPAAAREVLRTADVYGNEATVNNMHGLYSKLREIARGARAGTAPNKNLARVSDDIAEAILNDLGAVDGATPIGRSINEARAFSAEMHETFDRGAVGRVMKKTMDGDISIDPELTLARTVGRSGVDGKVGAEKISATTEGKADEAIADYIKDRFSKSAVSPTGEFTRTAARRFTRDNSELLKAYPELRADIDAAVNAGENAANFGEYVTKRLAELEGAKSIGRAAVDGSAVKAVLSAESPRQAARKLANEARKDTSGAALSGIKGAFADELIIGTKGVRSGADTFGGDKLLKALSEPKMNSALRQVFSSAEMGRLRYIGKEIGKIDGKSSDIGASLSNAKPSKIIEFAARIAAARHGAGLGGGAASLQTAQMASGRMKALIESLTADKASQIMSRAVEDPELFKALLTDARRIKPGEFEDNIMPRLLPYLVGTASTSE